MKKSYIIALLSLLPFTSCKKFLAVDPPSTKVDMAAVFSSDATAISLMNGIYTKAGNPSFYTFSSFSLYGGLSADELVGDGQNSNAEMFYKNHLQSQNFSLFWAELYSYIYIANQIQEGLNGPNGVSAPIKARLMGEAKFMRAYYYFYLLNLFGDVPLVTATAYQNNVLLSRTPKAQVYAQIIQDLKDAQNLLGTDYVEADLKTVSSDRLRPNKWAAAALLARVYLFTGDYASAITASSDVIGQSQAYALEPLDNAFLSASRETIFSLQSTSVYYNAYDGDLFILVSAPGYSVPASLSDYVYDAFEPGDLRKTSWVGSYTDPASAKTYRYAYKYKIRGTGSPLPLLENKVLLRLGEQYLIRAEAYIQTGKTAEGIADLNTLRTRSRAEVTSAIPDPLPNLSDALSKQDALQAVVHERQVELFTETGDRWLTLKRMKGIQNPAISLIDEIMPAVSISKGGTWNTNWQLYPLPLADIKSDKNLVQNPGY